MSWLIVIGERTSLRWVLDNGRMGFRGYVNTSGVLEGDDLAIYVTRGAFHNPTRDESQIVAVGSIGGPVRHRSVEISGEQFPMSVRLTLTSRLPERRGLPFKPLIPEMSFIRNKTTWASYMRRTLVPVPHDDFQRIERAFEEFVRTRT